MARSDIDVTTSAAARGSSVTRRQVIQRGVSLGAAAVGASALLGACGGSSSSAKHLNVLTWVGYHNRPWLDEFTRQTGITVSTANVSSPAEAYERVKAAPDQWDVVIATAGYFDQFVKSDLLLPIEESRLSNIKYISPAFPWRQATTVNGTNYGVLYQWGDQYMGWNEAQIPSRFHLSQYLNPQGQPIDWNIFWDPQLKGKVSIFDDPVSVLPMVPLALGIKNPYQLDDQQFGAVQQKLFALRPQIAQRLTQGANDQAADFVNGGAVVGYMLNTSVNDLAAQKGVRVGQQHEVRQGIPSWSDNTSITKHGGGKKLSAVYTFLNTGLSLPWQKRLQLQYVGNVGLSYDAALKAGLTPAQLAKTLIPLSRQGETFFKHLVFFRSVENPQRRIDLWNQFKLGIGA